jgi:alpha-ketoglutarate-dependent taurine dioxygenase
MTAPSFITTSLGHCGLKIEAPAGEHLESLDRDQITSLFREQGALLFRGFGTSTEEFVTFSDRFSSEFSSYEGGALRFGSLERTSIAGSKTLLSTTGAGQSFPIPLHGEMYYFKQQPELIWFYCSIAPLTKGETTICDGRQVCEKLSPATRAFFRDHLVRYIRPLSREQWQTSFRTTSLDTVREMSAAQDTVVTSVDDEEGSIRIEFVAPAIQVRQGRETFINGILPFYLTEWAVARRFSKAVDRLKGTQFPLILRMEDGSPIPFDRIREVKQVADALAVSHPWQPGDVLMINNHTHLHGRLEADASERLIYVRMGETLSS